MLSSQICRRFAAHLVATAASSYAVDETESILRRDRYAESTTETLGWEMHLVEMTSGPFAGHTYIYRVAKPVHDPRLAAEQKWFHGN